MTSYILWTPKIRSHSSRSIRCLFFTFVNISQMLAVYSILRVSSTFRTPSTESIAVPAYQRRSLFLTFVDISQMLPVYFTLWVSRALRNREYWSTGGLNTASTGSTSKYYECREYERYRAPSTSSTRSTNIRHTWEYSRVWRVLNP